jgi:hypothetical protein
MARFGIRLFAVSTVNYFFGNVLFIILWRFFGGYLEYWQIAIICTGLASVFSFQTQSRFVLRIETTSFFNPRYTTFQLIGLLIAITTVPAMSSHFKLDIILVQFAWSAFFSLVSLLVLSQRGFDSSSKP